MSAFVQVALAETVAEAEEIEAILREAGIEAELETRRRPPPARDRRRAG